MDKIIIDFSDFYGGWMNMIVYDYRSNETRKMRISYIQDFFDDLLMLCRFLLSDITGIYEVFIDQEGFDASIKVYRYDKDKDVMSVEIREQRFEDEIQNKDVDLLDDTLYYTNVKITNFVENIINLIEKYKLEYNESFVLSPSNMLDEELLENVKKQLIKEKEWRDFCEKTSNT